MSIEKESFQDEALFSFISTKKVSPLQEET